MVKEHNIYGNESQEFFFFWRVCVPVYEQYLLLRVSPAFSLVSFLSFRLTYGMKNNVEYFSYIFSLCLTNSTLYCVSYYSKGWMDGWIGKDMRSKQNEAPTPFEWSKEKKREPMYGLAC